MSPTTKRTGGMVAGIIATIAALLLPRTPEAFRAAVPGHLLALASTPATALLPTGSDR